MNNLTVLMATYEGEKYLSPQIKSFVDQSLVDLQLIVSDDSRTNNTEVALRNLLKEQPGVTLEYTKGPQKGFVDNFSSLLLNHRPNSEYVAFSDQDDIWLTDKTKRSLDWLSQQPKTLPALYCGRTSMIDKDGNDIGRLSPLFPHEPAFENSLVQSIAGGNTMTMNAAAFDLIKRSLAHGIPVSHDWWAYIMVSGAGGIVKYDPEPLTLYRQHGENIVGENQSYFARLERIKMTMSGTWRKWQDIHLNLLDKNIHELDDKSRETFSAFKQIRKSSSLCRLSRLRRSGVWRQTKTGTLSLYAASLMNRI